MKQKFCSRTLLLASACLSAIVLIMQTANAQPPKPLGVAKYVVQISPQQSILYDGAYANSFGGLLDFAPGSGLRLRQIKADGTLEFWGLTDRGPNADTPKIAMGPDVEQEGKMFPAPHFSPSIALIRISKNGKTEVVSTHPLKMDKNLASGLPIPAGSIGSTGEIAVSDNLARLPFDPRGLDPEGIDVDQNGDFWICDEYGPFIVQIDGKSFTEIKRLGPGSGLPEIIGERVPNRGFEGLAIAPSGKIYAFVQSVLNVAGETRNSGSFVRLVEYDPKTEKTRMFAYPVSEDFKKTGAMKIGDLAALSDNAFLAIEQGETEKGMVNRIVRIGLSGATDLSELKLSDGRELEFANSRELKESIKLADREVLTDLRDLGWNVEKAEGLSLVSPNVIAVINDNDFGISSGLSNDGQMKNYRIMDGKLIDKAGKPADEVQIVLSPSKEATHLWLVTFDQPLK